jgi:hypothetical protein
LPKLFGQLLQSALVRLIFRSLLNKARIVVKDGFVMTNNFMQLELLLFVGQFRK